MFYFFGVGLNLFLLVLLLSKKSKSFADKILAGWLLVIGCHLSLYVLSQQPVTLDNIHQMGVSIPFPFLHGPFLYLYTAAVTQLLPVNRKWLLLHFLPVAVILVFAIPLFAMSAAEKMEVLNNKGRDYADFMFVAGWVMRVSGVAYVIWCFLLLRQHKKNIGELFSYEERINLNWLRYLIYACLAVWIIIIFVKKDSFIFGAVVVFVVLLGYFGIKQVGIFGPNISLPGVPDQVPAADSESKKNNPAIADDTTNAAGTHLPNGLPPEVNLNKKYSSSGLNPEAAGQIHEKLTRCMKEDKLFTEPELSLSTLAAKLGVHPNYLSQVINAKEGKTFFDYINFLRVEEFKRLVGLPGQKQFTLMSIAMDCGFNSKSSFNKNFKKIIGQSPSEYLAQLAGSSPSSPHNI